MNNNYHTQIQNSSFVPTYSNMLNEIAASNKILHQPISGRNMNKTNPTNSHTQSRMSDFTTETNNYLPDQTAMAQKTTEVLPGQNMTAKTLGILDTQSDQYSQPIEIDLSDGIDNVLADKPNTTKSFSTATNQNTNPQHISTQKYPLPDQPIPQNSASGYENKNVPINYDNRNTLTTYDNKNTHASYNNRNMPDTHGTKNPPSFFSSYIIISITLAIIFIILVNPTTTIYLDKFIGPINEMKGYISRALILAFAYCIIRFLSDINK